MNVNAAPFNTETAFRTHYGRVARIIARVVRDHARAEELAVEVFLKLWRTRNAQADKVEAWLYRVAVRTALDEATVSPQASIQLENGRKVAPDFDLKDQDGNEVRLSGLKGKVVLVNFWATWCEGCQVEIPWFVEFEKKYSGQGLVVVGVSMDEDGWKSVKPWLKEKKVNYPIVIGNDQLGNQYRLEAMPLTVLVDRQGRIAGEHPGVVKKADTEKHIRTLLDEGVGSEEARLHASLRPPLKLHVRFSRMQLSRRLKTSEMPKRN